MQQGTTEQRLKQSNEILKMKVAQLEAEIVMYKTKIAQLDDQLKYCSCQYESMKLFKD